MQTCTQMSLSSADSLPWLSQNARLFDHEGERSVRVWVHSEEEQLPPMSVVWHHRHVRCFFFLIFSKAVLGLAVPPEVQPPHVDMTLCLTRAYSFCTRPAQKFHAVLELHEP